jgi:osmoprotectant transport system permease protein
MNALRGFVSFLAERRAELVYLAAQHLGLVVIAVGVAAAIAIPLGVLMTRRPSLPRPMLALANIFQTIPSLALFGFLIPLPFLGGIGARTAVIALVLYSLLPILRNTYTGIRGVDRAVVEAATALGMTDMQRLFRVELPLAAPFIVAGLRLATVAAVGTATIAAAIGAGGLGTYIFRGIATVDARLILAGAIPAALMALGLDALLGRGEKRPRTTLLAVLGVIAVTLAWWGVARERAHDERPKVVVGTKNFTEQVILGELASTLLESRGFRVDRRLNLGGTSLCHQAVRTGQIDVYYEYTGTALKDVLKRPTRSDRAAVLEVVRAGYAPLGLDVGAPLGFNNTFALVTRPDTGLRRISDLAERAASLRVGLFGEFLERDDGMDGLLRHYGFRFGLAPREMDLGLLYRSLAQRQVDVVVGSATDGLIAAMGLVVLADDRGYFPPYDAVAIFNRARSMRQPGVREALASLEGRIDDEAMRRLNLAVDRDHRSPHEVAQAFLLEHGLSR